MSRPVSLSSLWLLCIGSATLLAQPYQLQPRPLELQFVAAANGAPPIPQVLEVVSTVGSPVRFSLLIDGGAPGVPAPGWLRVPVRQAVTPARLLLEADPAGLPAGEAPPARIVPTNLAGLAIGPAVTVRLRVEQQPRQLRFAPYLLEFFGRISGPQTLEQAAYVWNAGSGSVEIRSVETESETGWLRAAVASCSGWECRLHVTATTRDLEPGAYRGTVHVVTAEESLEIPVSLFLASDQPTVEAGPEGLDFVFGEGQSATETRQVWITNLGPAPIDWRAEAVSSQGDRPPWLAMNPQNGSLEPNQTASLAIQVDPSQLRSPVESAVVKIASPFEPSVVRYVTVTARKLATVEVPALRFWPTGVLFTTRAGDVDALQQQVHLYSPLAQPGRFYAGAWSQGPTAAGWLSATPGTGTISGGTPAIVTISAGAAGFPTGIFRGAVDFTVDASPLVSLPGLLVVYPEGPCVPQEMAVVLESVPGNFTAWTGFAVPLVARAVSNCGQPVENATILVSPDNGDPSVALQHIGEGRYVGTWVPFQLPEGTNNSAVALHLRTWAPGMAASSQLILGTLRRGDSLAVAPHAIVHNSWPRLGGPLAPGTPVQIYGAGFAATDHVAQLEDGRRLPTELARVRVWFGRELAPLYFVGPHQVTAQVPVELEPLQRHQVLLQVGDRFTVPQRVALNRVAPGVVAFPDGMIIAHKWTPERYLLLGYEAQASPGDYLILYLTGLGETEPFVGSGLVPPRQPPWAVPRILPVVVLADKEIDQLGFVGQSPCCVGLFQINLQLPGNLAPGNYTLRVRQGLRYSNAVTLPVR